MHTIAAFEENVITFCLGPSIKKKNSVALVTHFSKEMLLDSIKELIEDGLLSDERFAESYFQSRKNRGHRPLRIRNELKQKGV